MSDYPTVTSLLDEWAHEKKLDSEQRIELLLEFVEFDQGLDEEFARFLDKKSVEAAPGLRPPDLKASLETMVDIVNSKPSKPVKRRNRSPVK